MVLQSLSFFVSLPLIRPRKKAKVRAIEMAWMFFILNYKELFQCFDNFSLNKKSQEVKIGNFFLMIQIIAFSPECVYVCIFCGLGRK